MTNLLEKSLLTGFGIFTLILFLSIILPFFGEIAEFKESKDEWENDIEEEKAKKDESEEKGENQEEEIGKKVNFIFETDNIKSNYITRDKINYDILKINRNFSQKIYYIILLQINPLNFLIIYFLEVYFNN